MISSYRTQPEVAQETNFYILSKTGDGLKISGLIIMTQKQAVTY